MGTFKPRRRRFQFTLRSLFVVMTPGVHRNELAWGEDAAGEEAEGGGRGDKEVGRVGVL